MPFFLKKHNPNKHYVLTIGPLPKDGANVAWKTNINPNGDWKEGTFDAGEKSFLVGFDTTATDWNYASDVYIWKYMK